MQRLKFPAFTQPYARHAAQAPRRLSGQLAALAAELLASRAWAS